MRCFAFFVTSSSPLSVVGVRCPPSLREAGSAGAVDKPDCGVAIDEAICGGAADEFDSVGSFVERAPTLRR